MSKVYTLNIYSMLLPRICNKIYMYMFPFTGDGNVIDVTIHHKYRKHVCFHSWKDVNVPDIKIVLTHIIIMSLVQKANMGKYWFTTDTNLIGKFMSQNKF